MEPEALAQAQFRAQELARRTVEYHRQREAEHRSRERYGRQHVPYAWADAAAAVLRDEALEDEGTAVALIKELGRQGCCEVALSALDLVLTRGSPPPCKALFDAALSVAALEFGDETVVTALLERMRSLSLAPDLLSYNLALTGLCCRGDVGPAEAVLAAMAADGLGPNSYSVLLFLQACNFKRRGAYKEALQAVKDLLSAGHPMSEEVVEALLQVCEAALHKAPSFETAMDVFDQLGALGTHGVGSGVKTHASAGGGGALGLQLQQLASNTRIYNGLLAAAGRTGRWQEAQHLYALMKEEDVPATLDTYTALIQACVVGRALEHALEVFEYLVAGRAAHDLVPASITTYNHLIHACHQAGMLEKALEIAAWVQRAGVAFDDATYEELQATIEVAQLWDQKAVRQALQRNPAVLPQHLRPAPYDAMRVMYLDHLEALQEEELLALEKLGAAGSWAPTSLTRGSMGLPDAQQASSSGMPSPRHPATSALAMPPPSGTLEAEPSGHMSARELAAYVRAAGTGRGSVTLAGEVSGVSVVSSSGVTGEAGAGGMTLSRAPSMRQLYQTGGPMGGVGRQSARSGMGLPALAHGGGGSRASSQQLAPTGFHNPPAWAALQSQDAATAGPRGTPFVAPGAPASAAAGAQGAAGAGGGGGGGGVVGPGAGLGAGVSPLALALEPANPQLFAQSSSSSVSAPTTRMNLGGQGVGVGVGVGADGASRAGSLATFGGGQQQQQGPFGQVAGAAAAAAAAASGGGGSADSSGAPGSGLGSAAGLVLQQAVNSPRVAVPSKLGARKPRLFAQVPGSAGTDGGMGGLMGGVQDFLPSPLPAMSSIQTVLTQRRFPLAPLTPPTGQQQAAAAGAGGGL